MTQTTFDTFNFQEPLSRALAGMGFSEPTEIQKKAIPRLLGSAHDFVGQAQTGTGKTAAFLLPLLENMNFESSQVESLILTPTRELALQVHQELEKLAKFTSLRSTTVYGGTSYDKQIRAFKKDRVQVVVGTPGRVLDLIKRGVLKLSECHNFVIDEADEMLNMGFLEDVETIIRELPEQRKIWMFSATMPEGIKKLVSKNFSQPEFLKTSSKSLANNDIKQCYVMIHQKDHVKGLRRIIETDAESQGIVFCETREGCKKVSEKLQDLGVSALPLHGDLNQAQREYAMGRFKAKKVRLLVCTDIAARGIDVNDLKFVFNMGFPRQDDSYVHRIGRTGRAGTQGMAITFVDQRDKYRIKQLEKKSGVKMEAYELPTIDELKSVRVAQELQKLEGLVNALKERGEDFSVDKNYDLFREGLKDLSKEDILKIFFSQKFNKDFRMIEEALQIKKTKPVKEGKLRASKRRRPTDRGDRGGRGGDSSSRRTGGGRKSSRRSSSRKRS